MNAQKRRAQAFNSIIEELDKYKSAFLDLVDTHYGASYHHIGDGDGIPQERADELRELIRLSQKSTKLPRK